MVPGWSGDGGGMVAAVRNLVSMMIMMMVVVMMTTTMTHMCLLKVLVVFITHAAHWRA